MWVLEMWDYQGSSLDLPNPGNSRENPLGWHDVKTGVGRDPCSPCSRAPESLSMGAVKGPCPVSVSVE